MDTNVRDTVYKIALLFTNIIFTPCVTYYKFPHSIATIGTVLSYMPLMSCSYITVDVSHHQQGKQNSFQTVSQTSLFVFHLHCIVFLETSCTTQQCFLPLHTHIRVTRWSPIVTDLPLKSSAHLKVCQILKWGGFVWSHLSGANPLLGWIHEKFLQEINGLRGRVGHDFLQRDRRVIFKCNFVVIWQLCDLL